MTDVTQALAQLQEVVARVRTDEFEVVHPGRWRHLATGDHIETGYIYGEAKLRIFLDGGRSPDAEFTLLGRGGDLDGFYEVFPRLNSAHAKVL